MIGPNKRKRANARKIARDLRLRVLKYCEKYTAKEASRVMGLGPNDIANLRAGNGPSLVMIMRLVKNGGFTANSIFWGKTLRKQPKGTATRGVRADLITKRVSQITIDSSPQELAKKTGLAAITIYQYRTRPPKVVSLHTLLCFIEAGFSAKDLLFGSDKPAGKKAAKKKAAKKKVAKKKAAKKK